MKTLICAMTMMMGVMGVSAQSKPAPGNSYTGNARSRWNAIKRNISASAKAMPDAGYAFKPTADVRTFEEVTCRYRLISWFHVEADRGFRCTN